MGRPKPLLDFDGRLEPRVRDGLCRHVRCKGMIVDDRPCHKSRCLPGRACFEPAGQEPPVA